MSSKVKVKVKDGKVKMKLKSGADALPLDAADLRELLGAAITSALDRPLEAPSVVPALPAGARDVVAPPAPQLTSGTPEQ